VPVILVLTKFDIVVSEVLSDIAPDDVLQRERARARAHAMCEDSLRRRFDKDPRDVPTEIVSGASSFSIRFEGLISDFFSNRPQRSRYTSISSRT
jgi:hypothetical protein